MNDIFLQAFSGAFSAILKIALVVIAVALLRRKQIITDAHLKGLATTIIALLLPCMIFTNLIKNFDPSQMPNWWIVPIGSFVIMVIGVGAGLILFRKSLPEKKEMLNLCGIHNGGYLVLPLIHHLFPDNHKLYELYTFLFIIMLFPLIWSLGKYLTCPIASENGFSFKALFTPPFWANIFGLAIILIGWTKYIPETIVDGASLLGEGTIPVVMVILGGSLGSITFSLKGFIRDALSTIAVKLILVPGAVLAIVLLTPLSQILPNTLCLFFVIQAACPPSTATLIQLQHYGGNLQKNGSIIILHYLAIIITLPFWIALYSLFTPAMDLTKIGP